jgi:hypothetical protein
VLNPVESIHLQKRTFKTHAVLLMVGQPDSGGAEKCF